MKTSTTHDALLGLLLHQQDRLLDSTVTSVALAKDQAAVLLLARKMAIEGIKVTPESVSLHPEGNEKMALIVGTLLSRNPPDAPFAMLVEAVKKENLRSSLSALCRKFYDNATDLEHEPTDTLLDLHGEVSKLTAMRATTSCIEGSDMSGFEERITWRQQHAGMLRGPSVGIRKLDQRLNGLTPRFYIIGARPSVGKSALLGNWVESLCEDGKRVLIFTWEMPADDYRERLISSLSGVNLTAYSERPLTIAELEAINRSQRQMKHWDWYINDDPDTTIDDVEAQAMSLHRERPLDMVGIDYLQLVRHSHRMKRFDQVSEISNRLARLKRRLGTCAVVALSQLRRVEGKYDQKQDRTIVPKPELQDLRESGDLEQDADCVLLLHRDIRHDPFVGELIVAKQRGGPTGQPIELSFDPSTTKYSQL